MCDEQSRYSLMYNPSLVRALQKQGADADDDGIWGMKGEVDDGGIQKLTGDEEKRPTVENM